MGGFGVLLGDDRNTAAYILLDEEQTDIRGELYASLRVLHASLRAPEDHRLGERSLMCPDCLLIAKGVLGWAQRWWCHNWSNIKGPIQHRALLHPLEEECPGGIRTSVCSVAASCSTRRHAPCGRHMSKRKHQTNPMECVLNRVLRERADPSKPKKHSIACRGTQCNIQY